METSPTFTERDLAGRYHTRATGSNLDWFEDPNLLPNKYFHRTYQFSGLNGFEVHYVFFADESCETPQISAIFQGRCWLKGAHPTLSNTRMADFRLDKLLMAIFDRDLLQATPEAQADEWRLGLYHDVTAIGCESLGPLFGPLSSEHTDYDIVFCHSGVLKTGMRTATMTDGPDGRPTRLQDALYSIREQSAP